MKISELHALFGIPGSFSQEFDCILNFLMFKSQCKNYGSAFQTDIKKV